MSAPPKRENDEKRAQATARMLKKMREGEEKDNEKLNNFFNQKSYVAKNDLNEDQNLIDQAQESYECICKIIKESNEAIENPINLDICNLFEFFSASRVPDSWISLFGSAEFQDEIESAVKILRSKSEAKYLVPRPDLVLNPFKMFPLGPSSVKVLLITNSLAFSGETSLGYAFGYKNYNENAELNKLAIAVAKYRSQITGNEILPVAFDKTFSKWIMQGVLMLNLAFLDVPNTNKYNKKSINDSIWLGVYEMLIDHLTTNGTKNLVILFTKNAAPILKINLKNAHAVIFDIDDQKIDQDEFNKRVGSAFVKVNTILSRDGESSIMW